MCSAGKAFSHLYFNSFMYSFIHQYGVTVYQVPGIVLVDIDNVKSKIDMDCARRSIKRTCETKIYSRLMVGSSVVRRRQ